MTAVATDPSASQITLVTTDQVERGDIWWCDLGGSLTGDWKIRPVVVITGNTYASNPRNMYITVVPLTSFCGDPLDARRDEVIITPTDVPGLPRTSITNIATVQSIPRQRLRSWIDCLPSELLSQILRCIDIWFGRQVAE